MRVLVVAPHPFYQERGTPIAVDLLLRALSERDAQVDLLTFHEGQDRSYPGLTIHRCRPWFRVTAVPPGFSGKKLACDAALFFRFVRLLRSGRYDVVHAVEEAGMMASVLCPLFSVPYVYDMDSLISRQIVDKYPKLRILQGLMAALESLPMRHARVVVPMCDALATTASRYRADGIEVLRDVSLAMPADPAAEGGEALRESLGVRGPIVMYVGNLEPYQGITLLLESVARALSGGDDMDLVVIGGSEADIEHHRSTAATLKIAARVHLLGPRPLSGLGYYLRQADVLVSPRTQGVNTPMKIYSYMDSGVPILATRLATHTQVLDDDTAALAAPEAAALAAQLGRLLRDGELRERLAAAAKSRVHREHSYESFRETVNRIYDGLGTGAPSP